MLPLLFDGLDELGRGLDDVQRRVQEGSYFDSFDVGLVKELVIGGDLDVPVEVGGDYQELLWGAHTEGNVLRVIYLIIHKFLLGKAGKDF